MRRILELLERHSNKEVIEFLSLMSWEAHHGLGSHAGPALQRHPVFRSVTVRRWQDYLVDQIEAQNSFCVTKVDIMSVKGARYEEEEVENIIYEEMETILSEDMEDVEEEMDVCVEETEVEGPRL